MDRKVRGTQKQAPPQVEINADTVYLRQNVMQINEGDFSGWEYEEQQFKKDEFIARIGELEKENAGLIMENMFLSNRVGDTEKLQADLTIELIMKGVL